MTDIIEAARSRHGEVEVFTAKPPDFTTGPGLVVLQEAFGVNDHIKDVTRRLAAHGYVAAAPDLFHRFGQRLVLYEDKPTAIGLVKQLTDTDIINDVTAATGALLKHGADPARIGVIGFCFGGLAAFVAATRWPAFAACVSFYGGGIAADAPDAPISRASDLTCPALFIFGGQDESIPPAQIRNLHDSLTALGKPHRIKVFDKAGHAFVNDARPAAVSTHHPEAAAAAWQLATEFLAECLQP